MKGGRRNQKVQKPDFGHRRPDRYCDGDADETGDVRVVCRLRGVLTSPPHDLYRRSAMNRHDLHIAGCAASARLAAAENPYAFARLYLGISYPYFYLQPTGGA